MKHFTLNWALALILAISLGLTGCGDDDGASKNNEVNSKIAVLELEDVEDLDECSDAQKHTIKQTAMGQERPSHVRSGLCVNTEDEDKTKEAIKTEFENLRNAVANWGDDRDVCKWTYSQKVWFCSPNKTN